jgi:putative nucleotidyltransferase with HDIG domain
MKIPIKKLVHDVSEGVSFPRIAVRILKLFEDDSLSTYQLAKAISLDPILAAYILKISNSAFYGFKTKIKNLSDAIALIGFEEVRKIVVMVSMKNAFSTSDEYDKILWEHSLAVGVACSELNRILKITNEGEAYIMGLLHDIGKVVFKKSKDSNYNSILEKAYNSDIAYKTLEEEEYGYNHADVGAYLLETWNFDQEIIDAVGFHHMNFAAIKKDFLKPAALVSLSDFLSNMLGIGKRNPVDDLGLINDFCAAKFLGYYDKNPIDLVNTVHMKFSELKKAFES